MASRLRKCSRCALTFPGARRICYPCAAAVSLYQRDRYRMLREAGLCVGCKRPWLPAVRCRTCAAAQAHRLRKHRRKARRAAASAPQ